MVRSVRIIFLLASLCLITQLGFSQQECIRFENTDEVAHLISYLREQREAKSDPACIVLALRKLGTDRVAPPSAVPLLTEYLEYKRPLSAAEQKGIFRRPPTISEMYPASSALVSIGRDAVSFLAKTIADEASSQTKRENAVFTIMVIFRDDETLGVQFLHQAATKSKDPVQAHRLTNAAREALRWCGSEKRAACESALND